MIDLDDWIVLISAVVGGIAALLAERLWAAWTAPRLSVSLRPHHPFVADTTGEGRDFTFLRVLVSNSGASPARECRCFLAGYKINGVRIDAPDLYPAWWTPSELQLRSLDIPAGLGFFVDIQSIEWEGMRGLSHAKSTARIVPPPAALKGAFEKLPFSDEPPPLVVNVILFVASSNANPLAAEIHFSLTQDGFSGVRIFSRPNFKVESWLRWIR